LPFIGRLNPGRFKEIFEADDENRSRRKDYIMENLVVPLED
jgi:hypothetical protein